MIQELKRVAVQPQPEEVCAYCGAVTGGTMESRKFGFLLSDDTSDGFARVRFLGPRGFSDVEVPAEQVLGVVGETYVCSTPSRPEVCERVIFFDRGRQRKAWVKEVEADGRVTLVVGDIEIERWVEELVLLSLGEGFHTLSQGEVEKLDAPARQECGARKEKEVGNSKDLAALVRRVDRGAEEVNALLAELVDNL